MGPEMPGIGSSEALSRIAERLAGAGAGPAALLARDPGDEEGAAPSADSSEEVALVIPGKVSWLNVGDAALVNESVGDKPVGDKFSEPLGGRWIKFIVVIHTPYRRSRLPSSRGGRELVHSDLG